MTHGELVLRNADLAEQLTRAEAERDAARGALARALEATGQVIHKTREECAGCGCLALTAEEAVAALKAERDAALEELRWLRLRLRVEAAVGVLTVVSAGDPARTVWDEVPAEKLTVQEILDLEA